MLVSQSSHRYQCRTVGRDDELRALLTALAQQYPRFGSPRLCVLVEREAQETGSAKRNHKVVERVYRELGLSLRRKKRKRLARAGVPLEVALAANQEWAMDFVSDGMACGRQVRVLTVVDVFTRECLALATDTSIGSQRLVRVLEAIIAERGKPQRIRSDNGPEFTSRVLDLGSKKRSGARAYPPGQADRERLHQELQWALARGVLERELVQELVRCPTPD